MAEYTRSQIDTNSPLADSDAEVSDRANFSGEKKGTMRLSGGYRCSRKWGTAHPDLR